MTRVWVAVSVPVGGLREVSAAAPRAPDEIFKRLQVTALEIGLWGRGEKRAETGTKVETADSEPLFASYS